MGQYIGFTLYEKKPLDEENKLVKAKADPDLYICGRCDVTSSWGEYFDITFEKYTTPVFQKELADKVQTLEEYSERYKYIPFEDFKQTVMDAVEEEYATTDNYLQSLLRDNYKAEKEIKNLRELQKSCTEDQAYAFKEWGYEIKKLKDEIDANNYTLEHYKKEDYDYTHAQEVEKLINALEKYLKEDKYYVIPYSSY